MRNLSVFIIAIGMLLAGQARAQTVGESAPDFTVDLLGGETFTLSDHTGKVVVVFLFGNTCPLCKAAAPYIESDLYQAYKDDPDFVMIGVDTWNSSSNTTSVAAFKSSTGVTFPLAIKAGSVGTLYGTQYDRLMVIDSEGILAHKGTISADDDLPATISAVENSLDAVVMPDLCLGANLQIAGSVTDATCAGEQDGMIDVSVTGAYGGFSYDWSNGSSSQDITGVGAGTYTLTVHDSEGCPEEAQFKVQEPDPVQIGAISGETQVTEMAVYSYSLAEDGSLDIAWTISGGEILNGQGTAVVEVRWEETGEGLLTARGISGSGCESQTVIHNVTVAAAPEVGDPAPDFTVDLLDDGKFTLSEHEGKVVAVFLFGNTCPYCIASGPSIESSLYQEFMDDPNFVMIGVDTWDGSSNETSVSGFRNSTGITFPLALKAGHVASTYGTTYDRLLVINAEGTLVHKGVAPTSSDLGNAIQVVENSLEELVMPDACLSAEISVTGQVMHPVCPGEASGVIDITVTGSHPEFSFLWNNGSTAEDRENLAEGIYTLTVTDTAGCTALKQFTLSDPDPVTLGSIMGADMVTEGETAMYDVIAMEGSEVSWTAEGGSIVSGQGTPMVDVLWDMEGTGTLTAVAESEAGCISDQVSLDITVSGASTAVLTLNTEENAVYPNPVTDIMVIGIKGDIRVLVSDMSGRMVLTSGQKQVDMGTLPAGLYQVTIFRRDGVIREKVFKQ